MLDHCGLSKQAACKTASDCKPGALCTLTGLTDKDLRGNRDMKSACSDTVPEPVQSAEMLPAEAFVGKPSVFTRLSEALDRPAK